MNIQDIRKELQTVKNTEKAKILARFFKTGKGEYGEGDIFLGITVPDQRKVAEKYKDLNLGDLQELLNSRIHEERLIALLILTYQFRGAKENERKTIFYFYLKNTKKINNWDLVDLSAPNIVGRYLLDKDREILYKLTKSNNLWEKRISMLACFVFIKENDFKDALKISELLICDKHDLIHKAVGWMLREIGKRSQEQEENFLKKYYKNMPRTMLRYAIEKFPEKLRRNYLNGEIK